ncbi:MAG: S8 family serine peptidase [bacterium]|nr:MAG: S8 family serine peptidase [bacterium]
MNRCTGIRRSFTPSLFFIRLITLSVLLCSVLFVSQGLAQDSTRFDYNIRLKTHAFDPLDSIPAIPDGLRITQPVTGPSYQIIQFKRPLTRKQIMLLKDEYGLKLDKYISGSAYLEKVTPSLLDSLRQLKLFRWNGLYHPAYKVDPHIGQRTFVTEERIADVGLTLIVVLFPDADMDVAVQKIVDLGLTVMNRYDDSERGGQKRLRVKASNQSQVEDIARIDEVEWIEEQGDITDDNGTMSPIIQSNNVALTPIYDQGIHGEGQIVGLIDKSLDTLHCFFNDPNNNVGHAHRKVVGFRQDTPVNFNNPAECGATAATATTPAIPSGHGTHTGGTLAGQTPGGANNGIAFNARITFGYNVDLTWYSGTHTFYEYLVAAHDDGARIHSNSWSDKSTSDYTIESRDLDNFSWNNEDDLVVVSSSNNRDTNGDGVADSPHVPRPPWTSKNGLCVGASQQFPNQASVNNGGMGPTNDGRRKPEIYAPGEGIISSRAGTNCGTMGCTGSSMATPAIAGAAALTRQYFLEGWYPSGTKQLHNSFVPSGALLKATLLNGTRDMNGNDAFGVAAPLNGYPTDLEGWGRLVLDDALYFQGDGTNLTVWDIRHENGLYTGESHNYSVEVVNNATPLKVTLVWTEPPGTSNDPDPVVNDLNLVVVAPNNDTYLGNWFAGGQSAIGGVADDVNNVEQVLLNNPIVGEYTIQIDAEAVNQGKPGQGYAVVATADTPEPPVPTGDQNTLVVRVGLSDIMGGASPSLTTVQNVINTVATYINDVSYGEAAIVPEYAEVVLGQPSTYYYDPSRNVLIEMTQDVIDELITANPNVFDKGTPATNDDIDRMMIVLNDQNFTDDWATTGPWPYDLPGGLTRRISVSVNSIYNDPEERFEHALGHHFGMVDLYPYPGVTFAMPHVDEWDNMAFPLTGSDCLAWSKERATWISEHGSAIEYIARPGAGASVNRTIGLNFVSSQNQNTKAIAIGMTEDVTDIEDEGVFYFVEARTNSEAGRPDEVLPAEGVLLYYVHEDIPQGFGPAIIKDNQPGTATLTDAGLDVGDSYSVAGRGLTVTVNAGTGGADRDIVIGYDPPETDNDVNITVGSPAYTSPDIWIDSQKNGFDEDEGRAPADRGDNPVMGEVNRLYYRIYNSGPADAYDFTLFARVSEPYHTVGGAADFNVFAADVYFDQFDPTNSPIVDYVEWTPSIDYDPSTGNIDAHSCVEITIPDVFNDVNTNNNRAQQNLQEVASVHSSPYNTVTYQFAFTNPEDSKKLFYFRTEGVPDGWTAQLTPAKAHLNGNQHIDCSLAITPPSDAPVCTEYKFEVTSWMAKGHTLVPVGGGTFQVDLRNNTQLTLGTQLQDCDYTIIRKIGAMKFNPNLEDIEECAILGLQGCTNPPRPFEEIVVRYEDPSGYPIYRTVVTDELGCYNDFYVVAEGGDWGVTAEYLGSDCDGPALAYVDDINIPLPQTGDQDHDGKPDQDEPQGDHDHDGILGIYDTDSDNDGVVDGDEPDGDPDRDGHENIVDRDSDGDGTIDGVDPEPYPVPPFKKFGVSLHSGMAFPVCDFADVYDPGINFLIDVGYWFSPRIAVVGFFGYNDFKSKIAGIEDNYMINLSLNAKLYQPYMLLPMPPWSYYLNAGPGVYIPKTGDTELGFNVGAGINYEINNSISIELGGDYHQTFNNDVKFIHAHGGVIIRF